MQALALISGLIGALLSAALSYWVRAILAKRAQKEAERRVAYVHFVRISELVASETILTSMLKLMAGGQATDSLGARDGSFEPSHKASVILAEQIRQLTPEKLKETSGMAILPHLLKGLLDNAKELQLSTDQLSKLPKETVLNYSFFLTSLTPLRLVYQLCGVRHG